MVYIYIWCKGICFVPIKKVQINGVAPFYGVKTSCSTTNWCTYSDLTPYASVCAWCYTRIQCMLTPKLGVETTPVQVLKNGGV